LSHTILIVDDDSAVCVSLSLVFKQAGLNAATADSPKSALEWLRNHHADCVVQDMNFSLQTSGEEGLQLLQDLKREWPKLPVILMTAWASIDLAVQGVKLGAADFVSKPWNNNALLQSAKTAIQLSQNQSQPNKDQFKSISLQQRRAQLDAEFDFSGIIGESEQLLSVLSTLSRVMKTDAPILILGESGTGKELIAEAIHRNSQRADKSMVKVNLGGIHTGLFDSEMFGHTKGAFTDAKSTRVGRFEAANEGSIFLDEIGDLDKSSQVKLLRVLQDKTYQPVGSSQNHYANVRVISATNHDLHELVSQGLFREDLLYRINLITVTLPALRERQGDIALIAEHVLEQIAKQYQFEQPMLDASALRWLNQQPWPGNIRQLRQTLERVVLINQTDCLHAHHFDGSLAMQPGQHNNDIPSGLTLDELEKKAILQAIEQSNGNVSQAAKCLGLTRQSLYRRLQKHNIEVDE